MMQDMGEPRPPAPYLLATAVLALVGFGIAFLLWAHDSSAVKGAMRLTFTASLLMALASTAVTVVLVRRVLIRIDAALEAHHPLISTLPRSLAPFAVILIGGFVLSAAPASETTLQLLFKVLTTLSVSALTAVAALLPLAVLRLHASHAEHKCRSRCATQCSQFTQVKSAGQMRRRRLSL
ncbi:hypothetical protein [Aquincola tertiaricarbonis]|uniref:hypothetical protein n=1 Tax=Aquincola tertiaricarbonis TaxID=391953 RepID=UPI0018DC545D|nr:hypothetical protein [Aquincola tertiaricarbonis]